MITFFRKLWNTLAAACEEQRMRQEEEQTIHRENLEAWNELNKDFINDMNRKTNKEIDDFCDVSNVPEPNAYNFDDSPLIH